ncbi:hypothetical protein K435DRAFT_666878, partial [Dendrothele bispora CBS 962.96]
GFMTFIVWITLADNADDRLAYGTDEGYLCIWKQNKNKSKFSEVFCRWLLGEIEAQEISSIAYNSSSHQLIVRHHSQVVHRFLIDGSMLPREIKSVSLQDHHPQALAFGHSGVNGVELWSFSYNDGQIHVVNEWGNVLKKNRTGILMTCRGDAVINVKDNIFAVDNMAQGIALYQMSSCEHIKTFDVPRKWPAVHEKLRSMINPRCW